MKSFNVMQHAAKSVCGNEPPPHGARDEIIDLHSHWPSDRVLNRLGQRECAQWIEARLASSQESGTSHELVSWSAQPSCETARPQNRSKRLYGQYNDDLAALVTQYPQRLSGLAKLAPLDIQWSANELARAYEDLGLIGAVLPMPFFASKFAATSMEPILKVAQRYAAHIYLHGAHSDRQDVHGRVCADTICTLAFSDVLRPYPNVTVQIALQAATH